MRPIRFSIIPLLFMCVFTLLQCADENALQRQESSSISTTPSANGSPDAVVISGSAPTICDYTLDEASLINAGWTKIFEDEFTTDLSKWNIWTGGAFNNELQHYQASNLQVSNGALVITAKRETVQGQTTPFDPTPKTFNFTSGRIECKTNVSANATNPKIRMVARIKLPAGYAMWPAFWSYGDPWPTQGEIDIVEARGNEPTKYQTNYFYGTQANTNLVRNASGYITANASLQSCYHLYEMIWEQDKLTSYLDGQVVEIKTEGGYITSLFGKTERITLNLAVGGNFIARRVDPNKVQPGTMYVDYVKVFRSN